MSACRLSRITAEDADGYHRVIFPAVAGKLRCPLRPASMSRPYDRPEGFSPPSHEPPCCVRQTMTVPPAVSAKTAQRYPYPGPAWQESYGRRSSAERSNATLKDPACVSIERGWCRLMGLPAITLMVCCLVVVRNLRIVESFEKRSDESRPRRRTRRRVPLAVLAATHPPT